jgi:hypothetical protein
MNSTIGFILNFNAAFKILADNVIHKVDISASVKK